MAIPVPVTASAPVRELAAVQAHAEADQGQPEHSARRDAHRRGEPAAGGGEGQQQDDSEQRHAGTGPGQQPGAGQRREPGPHGAAGRGRRHGGRREGRRRRREGPGCERWALRRGGRKGRLRVGPSRGCHVDSSVARASRRLPSMPSSVAIAATRSARGAFMGHTLADSYSPVTPAGTTVPSRIDHDQVRRRYRATASGPNTATSTAEAISSDVDRRGRPARR